MSVTSRSTVARTAVAEPFTLVEADFSWRRTVDDAALAEIVGTAQFLIARVPMPRSDAGA